MTQHPPGGSAEGTLTFWQLRVNYLRRFFVRRVGGSDIPMFCDIPAQSLCKRGLNAVIAEKSPQFCAFTRQRIVLQLFFEITSISGLCGEVSVLGRNLFGPCSCNWPASSL